MRPSRTAPRRDRAGNGWQWPQWLSGWRLVVLTLATLLVIGGAVLLWARFPAWRGSLTIAAALVGLVGVYPFTYVAYRGVSGNAQRERLQDDFRLLGLVREEELQSTVDKLYHTVYSPVQFTIYTGLIVAVALLVLYGYLHRVALGQYFFSAEAIGLAFYAFLGAYVFSVQELIRRYNTFDLQPQVYSSILVRVLVGVFTAAVGASVISAGGVNIAAGPAGGESPGGDPTAWAAVIAFVIGAFPSSGLRWFTLQTNRMLNAAADPESELPLRKILGISAWHEARLAQMGIDDAQNLATADIRRLLLTTQFDTQQIVHWIDQAILYVKVGSKLQRYRDLKLSSFHELRTVAVRLAVDARLKLAANVIAERTAERDKLAAALGLSEAGELEQLADFSNFPNYAYISEYYARTARVARQRASQGMDRVTGALQDTDYAGAIESGEQLLAQNWRDPDLLNRVGYAYYQLAMQEPARRVLLLEDALRSFDEALQLNPQFADAYHNRSQVHMVQGNHTEAIKDCTSAINLKPGTALIYNNRGLCYLLSGYVDRAIEDLDEALRLDDRLGLAYLNRGVALNTLGRFDQAVADFERAYLLGNRPAELWISWGHALIGRQQYEAAVRTLSHAVLGEQATAKAYAKRGYAYMQLGPDYYHRALNDLTAAVTADDKLPEAHVNLGLLKSRLKKPQEAIIHYQHALEIPGVHALVARYNLAVAYVQAGQTDDASREFAAIIKSDPDSAEARDARTYQSRLAASSAASAAATAAATAPAPANGSAPGVAAPTPATTAAATAPPGT